MGCGGGKASVPKPQRQPEDAELDDCDAEETAIPKFDGLFGDSLAPFQSCVGINNSLIAARDKIMEAAVKVAGGTRLRLQAQKGDAKVPFTVVYFTGEEEKDMSAAEVADVHKQNPNIKAKHDDLLKTITAFGKAVGKTKDAEWSVHSRQATRALCPQDKQSAAAVGISAANLKFELFRTLAKESMNLKKNIKDCFAEVKKALKEEAANIGLDVDMEGLQKGELKIDLKFGEKSLADVKSLLPPLCQGVFDAIAGTEEGNEGLIYQLKFCAGELFGLQEKLETAKTTLEGAKDIDPAAAAKEAGLNPMKIPAALKAVKVNMENAARAPNILIQTKDTLSALVGDVKDGITESIALKGAPKGGA